MDAAGRLLGHTKSVSLSNISTTGGHGNLSRSSSFDADRSRTFEGVVGGIPPSIRKIREREQSVVGYNAPILRNKFGTARRVGGKEN